MIKFQAFLKFGLRLSKLIYSINLENTPTHGLMQRCKVGSELEKLERCTSGCMFMHPSHALHGILCLSVVEVKMMYVWVAQMLLFSHALADSCELTLTI